jgi:formylglycine-generating enzyme required for sulfatase activity
MKTNKFVILTYFVIWSITITLPLLSLANVAPVVSNVQVQQQHGGAKVTISYNVVDADSALLTIMVLVSSDGGNTFTTPAQTCTGDIGWGVVPGGGKQIIWDAMADMPNVLGENYQAMVFASDGILGEDGAEMLLIPAGGFPMGNPPGVGNLKEQPRHIVFLDAFYIDKYEVTNAQYNKFWLADGGDSSSHRPINYRTSYYMVEWPDIVKTKPDNPVVGITWFDAEAYAKWAGKHLPTEAEWEKAARGTDARIWPWGNEFNLNIDGVTVHANTWDGRDGYDNRPSPVTKYPTGVSSFGVYGMAGNVWEWCADWFDTDFYISSPKENPTGPETGTSRAIRGGSWYNSEGLARGAFRMGNPPDERWYSLGFRCVQDFDLTRADEGRAFSNLFALDTRKFPSWDVNRDGVVDIQDIALVSKNFGKSGVEVIGDVNADGTVDISDLVIVGRHLGEITK